MLRRAATPQGEPRGVAAGTEPAQDDAHKIKLECIDREEAEQRCKSISEFLARDDAKFRVCLFCMVAAEFGRLKSTLLHRDDSWEMRGLAAGTPRSAVVIAASLRDAEDTLRRISRHLEGRDETENRALSGISGTDRAELKMLQFRSWARAGAGIYSYVLREQEARGVQGQDLSG